MGEFMRKNRKALAYMLITAAVSAAAVTTASAACVTPMAGKWHLHAMQADGAVIRCIATFGSNGNFSAPCKIFEAGMGTQISQNVTGTVTVSATCDVTGSVTVPGDPTVILRYGHINGNLGSGIATQGTGANLRVLHFTLVKQ
jgi:hypothetical protein